MCPIPEDSGRQIQKINLAMGKTGLAKLKKCDVPDRINWSRPQKDMENTDKTNEEEAAANFKS